jgi:hypothetical protein
VHSVRGLVEPGFAPARARRWRTCTHALTVIEGPFGEAKQVVAGSWILQMKSMDEAIEWAKRLPFETGGEPEAEGEIEIRQLFEMEEFG